MYTKYAELRDMRDLNDRDVAKAIGISTSIISEWKNGKLKPGIKTLLRISEFFKVPIETFISKEDYIH